MKTKKFDKKLSLSKTTVSHLEKAILGNVKGGKTLLYPCLTAPLTGVPCDPCARPSAECF